ncbi:MAG: acyl transferase, partial [Bacteroidota bacterium]
MSYEQQRAEIFQAVLDFEGGDFEALALKIFQFQAAFNELYARFLALLNVDFQKVSRLSDVPFLPIQFFKTHAVKTGGWQEETIFTSSGTTGATTSRHFVRDINFYRENAVKGFRIAYGELAGRCVLALLPSYLERSGSSLVCMAE